jgi:transporter family-2 protein
MYYFLSAFAAVLISVMVAVNGRLSVVWGLPAAVLIIHAVGLLFTTAAAAVKKEKLFSVRGIPAVIFSGGVVGYFTVLFNNMATGKISVAAILALSLLGQSVVSLVIDQFGLFGMTVRRFRPANLAGLAMVSAGIAFLLAGSAAAAVVPVVVSLLSGLTVVVSRSLNAQLAERTSVLVSTWYNYVTGIAVSAAALAAAAISGRTGVPAALPAVPSWLYLGGAVGAAVVLISNLCVRRMSSLAMTLVMFAGQVFGGVAIDAVILGECSWRSLAGGAFAFLGLILNSLSDIRADKRKQACLGKPA